MTVKEIAQATGKSERAVRNWVNRVAEKSSAIAEKSSVVADKMAASLDSTVELDTLDMNIRSKQR